MCRFIRSPARQPDQVSLAVEAAGGKLTATLIPPDGAPRMIFLDHVPLLRAVKMARLMADLLDTDVIVHDRVGIWHEWLVEWAETPVDGAEDEGPARPVHAGFAGGLDGAAAGWGVTLHAPA